MKDYPDPPEGLLVHRANGVLRLTLDRPDRRNAITDDMVFALIDVIDAAGSDADVRVILLDGNGDHFCSGFDLSLRGKSDDRPRTGATQRQMRSHVNRLVPTMLETQTPIVAVAKGWVIGLGLNLVLAADLAIVADDARLWAPFTTFGFTPDSGGSWLLPRLIGVPRAKEMLMLGRKVSGSEAADWGMIHRSAPVSEVDAAAAELVEELGDAATVAVGLAKLLVHRGLTSNLDHHLADEGFAMELSSRSADFAEYSRASRDKRPPDFHGR